MDIIKRSDGTFVAAFYHPTKGRYRTTLTEDFNPSEAASVDDLRNVRTYKTKNSVARAMRKFKDRL